MEGMIQDYMHPSPYKGVALSSMGTLDRMVPPECTPSVSLTSKDTLDDPSSPTSPTDVENEIRDGGREAWCAALGS